MNRGDIVEIYWVDTIGVQCDDHFKTPAELEECQELNTRSRTSPDELDEIYNPVWRMVGYLWSEDEKCIKIAATICEDDDDMDNWEVIPKRCITDIRVVEGAE